MRFKPAWGLAMALLIQPVFSATLTVPGDHPSVQAAIDSSVSGDIIVISSGTYEENILLPTHDLVIESTDPLNSTIVESTILDGGGIAPVFQGQDFAGTITLRGLSIQNGTAGVDGSASDGSGRAPISVENSIVRNNSPFGGISFISGHVHDSTVEGNTRSESKQPTASTIYGGGIASISGAVAGCIIRNNKITSTSRSVVGGGVSNVSIVENCLIEDNIAEAFDYSASGGGFSGSIVKGTTFKRNRAIANGIAYAKPGTGGAVSGGLVDGCYFEENFATSSGGAIDGSYEVRNSVFWRNSTNGDGGAISAVGLGVRNSTFVENTALLGGSALSRVNGGVWNNVFYNNDNSKPEFQKSAIPQYSISKTVGRGNIDADPLFVDAANGDFRLQGGSPAIDSGNRFYIGRLPVFDGDGMGRIQNSQVDMGAYEFGSEMDSDGDTLSDNAEAILTTNINSINSDGDGLNDDAEILRGTDPTTFEAMPGTPRYLASGSGPSIQEALYTAFPGEVIELAEGVYTENLDFMGNNINLRGPQPSTLSSIQNTIIDAELQQPLIITDITVQSPEIGTISDLTLERGFGENALLFSGASSGNLLWNMDNLIVRNNFSNLRYSSSGTRVAASWENCLFYNNRTVDAEGDPFFGSTFLSGHEINNCTFYNNDGGIHTIQSGLPVQNSILWNNSSHQITLDVGEVEYSLVKGGEPGIGNISAEPQFRDLEGHDFRLLGLSPGRNAAEAATATSTDLAGIPRDGTPDMGAFELISTDQEISIDQVALDFGTQFLDDGPTSPAQTITITNVGTGTLNILNFGDLLLGPAAADYQLTPTGTSSLLNGETLVLSIAFDPSVIGLRPATIRIDHDDSFYPTLYIPLLGRGVDATTGDVGVYTGNGPGISTIGTGGDYASMEAAISDINSTPLTGGNWTFEILNDLTETGPLSIGQELNGNTLTIRPAGTRQPTITFTGGGSTLANAHLTIGTNVPIGSGRFATSGVVIDGSNIPGGTSRDLTFENTISGGSFIGIVGDSDGTVIKNLRMISSYTGGSSTFGVNLQQVHDQTNSIIDEIPDNTVISNNYIENNVSGPAQGIWIGNKKLTGGSAADGSTGTLIEGNNLVCRARGFFLSNSRDVTIRGNDIKIEQTSIGTSGFGVLATHLGDVIDGVTMSIEGNNFSQLNAATTNPSGYGITGMQIEFNGVGNSYRIVNNMIGGLKLTATNGTPGAGRLSGILITSDNDADLEVLHNSISIMASDVPYTGLDTTNCIGFGVTNSAFSGTVDFRNNVIRIAQPDGVAVARESALDTWTSDYNVLSVASGARVSRLESTIYPLLSQWQALTGNDWNSRDIDPTTPNTPFTGSWISVNPTSSDLRFDAYPGNTYAALPIASVTTDVDGNVRGSSFVYMGAHERSEPIELPDSDGDGVADIVEQLFGNADNNNDTIDDYLQGNVVTLPNVNTNELVTIVSPSGTTLVAVDSQANPSPVDTPATSVFPVGFITFRIDNVTPGDTVAIDLIFPEGIDINRYWKYGPEGSNPEAVWYSFVDDGTTGAIINDNVVTLRITDGGRGDSDLTVNGRISDPGAPALTFIPATEEDWMMY